MVNLPEGSPVDPIAAAAGQPPQGEYSVDPYTVPAVQIMGRLATWPMTTVVTGPRHTGKSRVVARVAELLEATEGYQVHFIDGNTQSMSPEMLRRTEGQLLEFDYRHSDDPEFVIVDHLENFVTFGQNKALNDARRNMLSTLTHLTDRPREGSLSFLFATVSRSRGDRPTPTKAAMKFLEGTFLRGVVFPISGAAEQPMLDPYTFESHRLRNSAKIFGRSAVEQRRFDAAAARRTAEMLRHLHSQGIRPDPDRTIPGYREP